MGIYNQKYGAPPPYNSEYDEGDSKNFHLLREQELRELELRLDPEPLGKGQ